MSPRPPRTAASRLLALLSVACLLAAAGGCKLPGAGADPAPTPAPTPPSPPPPPPPPQVADAAAPAPDTAPDGAGGAELRLMSFNIRFNTTKDLENAWPLRRELAYRVIRDAAPDLLGLQEALRDQLDDLQAAFPDHTQIAVGRDDGQSAGEHSPILYRADRFQAMESGTFWLSETPEVPSKSWGEWPRICTWARLLDRRTGRSFYLYNTHLDLIALAREKGVEILAARIAARAAPADPVILMGDFNAGEMTAVIRYLKGDATRPGVSLPAPDAFPDSPRLIDTFRVIHPMAMDVRTNHGWRGDLVGDKIDYIFVERAHQARVLDAAIVRTMEEGRYPSDHYPVTAVLAPLPP